MERLLPGIIGGVIGFCGAWLLSVVARWREDEKSRAETRTLLKILLTEVEHRYGILMNRYADVDLSGDTQMGDIVKRINRGKSGVTFNYAEELKPYHAAFDSLKDRLGIVGADVAVQVWRHYTIMEENLLAHDNEMDGLSGDRDKAGQIRDTIRANTKHLIEALTAELNHKSSRAFLRWLPLWIAGKS